MDDKDKLIEMLTIENIKLKEGLVTVQGNLAESVTYNAETKEIYKGIDQQFINLVDNSKTILKNGNSLDEALADSMESSTEMIKSVTEINSFLNNNLFP